MPEQNTATLRVKQVPGPIEEVTIEDSALDGMNTLLLAPSIDGTEDSLLYIYATHGSRWVNKETVRAIRDLCNQLLPKVE